MSHETSVTLDYLVSQSNGDTLFCDLNCPLELIKEAILRGFQIQNREKGLNIFRWTSGAGNGRGNGYGFGFGGFGGGYFHYEGSGHGGGASKGSNYYNVDISQIELAYEYCPIDALVNVYHL